MSTGLAAADRSEAGSGNAPNGEAVCQESSPMDMKHKLSDEAWG